MEQKKRHVVLIAVKNHFLQRLNGFLQPGPCSPALVAWDYWDCPLAERRQGRKAMGTMQTSRKINPIAARNKISILDICTPSLPRTPDIRARIAAIKYTG